MKYGSLFSGAGLGDFGFELAGLECAWQVEIDDYCQKILNLRWTDVPKWKDIRTFNLDTIVNLSYNQLSQTERMEVDMGARRKDYDEAVRMYERGLSIGDISDFYGISRQAMWQILKIRGCEFREQLKYGKDNNFYRGTKASDKAQNILEEAIEKGIVQRKTHCEKCGYSGIYKDGRTAIQSHHPNYNKPLDVMWLCKKCHHEWHKNNKAISRKEVMPSEAIRKQEIDIIVGGFP